MWWGGPSSESFKSYISHKANNIITLFKSEPGLSRATRQFQVNWPFCVKSVDYSFNNSFEQWMRHQLSQANAYWLSSHPVSCSKGRWSTFPHLVHCRRLHQDPPWLQSLGWFPQRQVEPQEVASKQEEVAQLGLQERGHLKPKQR